ncbi:hypothetical protein ACHAWC_007193 [Mediolabrus comicus]
MHQWNSEEQRRHWVERRLYRDIPAHGPGSLLALESGALLFEEGAKTDVTSCMKAALFRYLLARLEMNASPTNIQYYAYLQ